MTWLIDNIGWLTLVAIMGNIIALSLMPPKEPSKSDEDRMREITQPSPLDEWQEECAQARDKGLM